MNFIKTAYRKNLLQVFFLISITLYLLFPPVARAIDGGAAPIDVGILSALLIAAIAVLGFLQLAYWMLHRVWPVFGHYLIHEFQTDFNTLLPWQKLSYYFSVLLSLLYAFILALAALL